MASWQAHALDLLLRITVKRKLRHNTDLASVRKVLNGGKLATPRGVTFTPATLGGVAGEWVRRPTGADTAPSLLYLHGGGYFACSPATHRPLTAFFARAGFNVFVPDYRLAPEHPYPAAIEDAARVYAALLATGPAPQRLAVAGDSAGGGLALALILKLRDTHQKLPQAAALFSPWTDLAITGGSVRENAHNDAMFWADGLAAAAGFYLGDVDARDPLASPLYGDLTGLPPLLIHVGAREMLRDDSLRVAEKAASAGVPVELRIFPAVPHVWQLALGFVPEARVSLSSAAEFLLSNLTASEKMPAATEAA